MNKEVTIILINAVVAIFTTIITVRLSLNQGKLGITNTFKQSAKQLLIKYGQITFFILLISNSTYEIFKFIVDKEPMSRIAIVMVSFNVITFMMVLFVILLELYIFIRNKIRSQQTDRLPH